MTPDDLARLRAAHIYDPDADDADEQLRLLERLESDGLGPDALLSADRLGTLVLSAFEQLIRPGRRRTTEEVAAATGTSGEALRRLWRAWGFPDPAPDDACWTDADVGASELFRDGSAFAGDDWALAMARAAGTAMSRVAESEVAFVRSRVEAPLVARGAARATLLSQYERVIGSFLPAAARMLDTLHRHYLSDFRRRYATALGPSANNILDVVVGFADVTGSTALVERLPIDAPVLPELRRTSVRLRALCELGPSGPNARYLHLRPRSRVTAPATAAVMRGFISPSARTSTRGRRRVKSRTGPTATAPCIC